MSRRLPAAGAACGAALLLAALATVPARSPSAAAGAARLEIIRPLRTATLAALQFGRVMPTGPQGGAVTVAPTQPASRTARSAVLLPGAAASALTIAVTGEPGRAYRIGLPSVASSLPGGYAVGSFTIQTRTSGVVTALRHAQLDATGTDTVLIGATLQLPKGARAEVYAAQVPVAISYE